MISQVVFDLPLEGPFDYLVPDALQGQVLPGSWVKVSFGPRTQRGYVVGLIKQSSLPKLKPILSLIAPAPVFNELDLSMARDFAAYYGCSLGEALSAMFRNKEGHKASVRREHKPLVTLYRCHPKQYAAKIKDIIKSHAAPQARFLVLVPDAFRADTLGKQLHGTGTVKIGTRSAVFEADGSYEAVVMVDEDDASYKQEQTPMYDTAQVLLNRSRHCGFDAAFVGICPSVELMQKAKSGGLRLVEDTDDDLPSVRTVDLSNYKFVPGMISPPVRDALEANLKSGKKSMLVLNRKGSYRITRCVDCNEVLKCARCDSPLIYSRSEGSYLCRHCPFTAPGDTVCPKCKKPSWRSQGMGVEQLQTELKKIFPQAKSLAFERDKKTLNVMVLPDFDILITTSAVLRFQGHWQVATAAFIDFDAELNRLDMRSAFNAFSLVLHISSMAAKEIFIQTRNSHHYVLQNLSRGNPHGFYDEELKLRQELGFSPFKHWIKIAWRAATEKSAQEAAGQVYNVLSKASGGQYAVTAPLADAVSRKRGQFRFNVMVETKDVPEAMKFIKSHLARLKRPSRVIMTLNVDP